MESERMDAMVHVRMPEPPQWLMEQSRTLNIAKGEQLVAREAPLSHVFIVLRGKINIFSIGENGQENKVVTVPEGGIVGEMEAIAGTDRIVYSARAFENSELLRIPVEPFLRWVRGDNSACWGLTQVLAEKLCAAAVQSSQYTSSDAMQRLIALLLQLGPGSIRYTRQELAEACSASLRTVNRCVKKMKEAGMIALCRGKIEISAAQMNLLREELNRNN